MADEEVRSGDLGYERLGSRRLGLVDVIAQSVGFMGPVFSVAFLIPAIAGIISATGKGAGTAAPLAVLIAAVGVFALGWLVAQYAKRIHAAGSLYDYVSNGLGRTIGAATGYLYYAGTIVLTIGLGVLIGGFIYDTLLLEFDRAPLPIWAWNTIWAVALFLVLYLGVRISTRVQLTLALISVAVVLAFFIYVIIEVGSGNDLGKAFDPSGSTTGDMNGVLFGVLYGVLIFVGFETAANLAEETGEPRRQIPRAVLFSVVVVSIFYVIAAYTQVAGFGFSLDALGEAAAAPLFVLASPDGFGSTALVRIMELVVLLDILAVGIGAAVASTRGVFAMSRDRRLPSPLASVSGKHGTPVGAIVLLIVLQALAILATEFWDDLFALPETAHYFAMFLWGSTFGGFALVVVYLLLAVGSLFGLWEGANRFGLVVAVVVGVAITAGAIYGAFADVTSPILLAPIYALVVLGVGLLAAVAFRGREPARVALPDLRTHPE